MFLKHENKTQYTTEYTEGGVNTFRKPCTTYQLIRAIRWTKYTDALLRPIAVGSKT